MSGSHLQLRVLLAACAAASAAAVGGSAAAAAARQGAALALDRSEGGRAHLMRRASPAGFEDGDALTPNAVVPPLEPIDDDREGDQEVADEGWANKSNQTNNDTSVLDFGFFTVENHSNISIQPFAPTEFPATSTCFDSFVTGISFHSGQEATCPELIYYCNHSEFGARVKSRCPKSCGLCDLFVDAHEDDVYCMDAMPQDPPIFMLQGFDKPQDCRDLRMFCDTDADVRWKCRSSCGVCTSNTTNATLEQQPEFTTSPWVIPTKDALSTTTTTMWTVEYEKDEQQMGCSRRRYMGFLCYPPARHLKQVSLTRLRWAAGQGT
eukprot:SRR837773.4600.p1 GENE.SRR837773.4600~~SRR837773.4600.p1  ORF type:complete len:334 (+),score=59.23 SRR837773.4600:38-1003(+)